MCDLIAFAAPVSGRKTHFTSYSPNLGTAFYPVLFWKASKILHRISEREVGGKRGSEESKKGKGSIGWQKGNSQAEDQRASRHKMGQFGVNFITSIG